MPAHAIDNANPNSRATTFHVYSFLRIAQRSPVMEELFDRAGCIRMAMPRGGPHLSQRLLLALRRRCAL